MLALEGMQPLQAVMPDVDVEDDEICRRDADVCVGYPPVPVLDKAGFGRGVEQAARSDEAAVEAGDRMLAWRGASFLAAGAAQAAVSLDGPPDRDDRVAVAGEAQCGSEPAF